MMTQAFQSQTHALTSATQKAVETGKENVDALAHEGEKSATLAAARVNLLNSSV
jgi:hypothetical protein